MVRGDRYSIGRPVEQAETAGAAPESFGLVHRIVRLLQQLLDVLAIPGKSADADADVRAQALGVNWRPEDIK
jgi:hypothetical protein